MELIAIVSTIFILVVCFSRSVRYWPLRNKTYEELTKEQKELVNTTLQKDRFKRNQDGPAEYLRYLQKLAVYLLILGLVIIILWIGLIYYIVNYF